MRAVVLRAPEIVEVVPVPDPAAAGRVLVAPREVGICGTDVKILTGDVPVGYPRILGHEVVGQVVDPGRSRQFAPGDRVLIDPTTACGHCARCVRGDPHLCGNGGLMGRDHDGAFCELLAVDERQLLAVPDDLPWEQGPLLQVLGTCVHGQSLVEIGSGDVAAVVGLGVSGLLHVQLLQSRGVGVVVGVTRSAAKLAMAEQLGAGPVAPPDDSAGVVAGLTRGEGADVVVEASGTLAGLASAVRLARPGGRVLMFGTITVDTGALPYYELYANELTLISSRAARHQDYAAAIDHVSRRRVELAPLVSARYALEDAPAALAACRAGAGLKVTMQVGAR